MTSHEKAKDAASLKALEFVQNGHIIGLGTGTTASHFISHLIEKCRKGLQIKAVATSIASEQMAREGRIEMVDINTIISLDLTIDGADEIDPQKKLIKGAGGALVREKILANMSKEMIVIADESKLVEKLGKKPLPVEIIPFGAAATKKHLERMGYFGQWRKTNDEFFYMTDNQNWILDIHFSSPLDHPEKVHAEMIQLPGVVDTGFFFDLAHRLVIGKADGSVKIQT